MAEKTLEQMREAVEEIRAKRTNSQSKLANIEQSIKALG